MKNWPMVGALGAAMLALGCDDDDTVSGAIGAECDTPALFAARCAGAGCHGADSPAAGLDLVSSGVAQRLSLAPASQCPGVLADPSDPEGSLLYRKVAGDPECGARMPLGRDPLSEAEVACVRDFIASLLPPCTDCVCEAGTTESCYEGPDGTLGVGQCVAGTRTCSFDGRSWGPCQGAVGPKRENCLSSEDEDCDGAPDPCTEEWSLWFGGEAAQDARSVAVDADGNVYLWGDFEGKVSFGGDPLTPAGKHDLVLAKYDKFGNYLWAKAFGDSSNQFGARIAVGPDGNLILAARPFGNVDFGGGLLTTRGVYDLAVAKLDREGMHIWSRRFGGSGADRPEGLAVAPNGDVIVVGAFEATADFGSGPLPSEGLRDAFVLRLAAATGDTLFARRAGGSGDDVAYGVATDAAGEIVVAGQFSGTLDELGGAVTSAGAADVFVARLSANGTPLWVKRFGGGGDDLAYDVGIDPRSGEAVLTGFFSQTIDFGGGSLVSAGGRDLFVARLGAGGDHVFSRRFGDAADQFASLYETNERSSVAIDEGGGAWIVSRFSGSGSFDGVTLSSAGANPDILLLSVSPGGAVSKARIFGSTGTESALDVAVAGGGRLVLAGRLFGGRLFFGPAGQVVGTLSSDGWIAKIAP